MLSVAAGFHCACSLLRLPTRTYARSCFKTKPRKRRDATKVNPLKKKIASDVRDILSHETVAVVHFGDLDTKAWSSLRLKLAQSGNEAQVIPTKIATRALDDTPCQNLAPLFKGSTALVYGNLDQTSSLLSCIKSEPRLCVLGGKVLDQLFTPRGLEEIAKLPPLEVLRQELVALLSLPQRHTLSLLQRTPVTLTQTLSLHVSSSSPSSSQETD
ncbi:39S ribosomal protein L10, mitochondrial [Geodia barretti]|uniref:Large ribosomal subunit protein uL10m n=1 Tax=Geodia barretti TaxID=519541 RepID=A0AA35WZM3_GEOBA|nr:39S ribosomal protein L10, mitochondrial [Geodia barretti]